jgi:guanosine-3',5'-bis(diphosphate) 3'-pyrophosphohydrolase
MTESNDVLFAAVAFAARVHRHQLRKDQQTPYVSHVFRVCLVVRHVFGFDDPALLTAALLHDTIEDTNTDCDDIIDHFGPEVARWVSALTKEKRLPHDEREADYARRLAAADWQVKVIKLADIYDNLMDSTTVSSAQQRKSADKARFYLQAVSQGLPPAAQRALELVEQKLKRLESSLT